MRNATGAGARYRGRVAIEVVFETHSTTEDNEAGRATGWLPGRLSPQGRDQAAQLGRRRRDDGITAVFCSDLARTAETAVTAFAGVPIPVHYDWRLRECDYGQRNGMPAAELHASRRRLDCPHPRRPRSSQQPAPVIAARAAAAGCAGRGVSQPPSVRWAARWPGRTW